jgi:hypothetical protein
LTVADRRASGRGLGRELRVAAGCAAVDARDHFAGFAGRHFEQMQTFKHFARH